MQKKEKLRLYSVSNHSIFLFSSYKTLKNSEKLERYHQEIMQLEQ